MTPRKQIRTPRTQKLGAALLSLVLLVPLCVAGMSSPVSAQSNFITITEGSVEPTPIAISEFIGLEGESTRLGRELISIIGSDLDESGLFEVRDLPTVVPPPQDLSAETDFSEWRTLGLEALLLGEASYTEEGLIQVSFSLWDVVLNRLVAAGEGTVNVSGKRRIAHQIADVVYKDWTGDDGYFDTRIVYVDESGPAEERIKRLAIMDHDGHNHIYLTDGTDLVLTPRFSHRVQEIVYLNYFNDNPRLYLLDIESGNSDLLGVFPGMNFAPRFSYDDRFLIMSMARNGITDIFEMDLSSRRIKQLTDAPSIETSPSYSPDGTQIAFNSDRSGTQQLYIMNRDGTEIRRISRGRGRYATPVWSPRGDLIAFTKFFGGEFFIGVMDTDGRNERLIARGFLVEGPTWSPSGRVLMYYKQNRTRSDGSGGETFLYRIDITGFNERRILTPSGASDPAWSPFLP